jgi:hypothetical protein
MAQVEISDKLRERIAAFKPVIEAVLEEEVNFDYCAEIVLERGLETMLSDLLGMVEPAVLLASFQQLAAQHPEEVYGFVAATLQSGAAAVEREHARQKFGFAVPEASSTVRPGD